MANRLAQRLMKSYLNKTLSVLALAFAAAVVLFGVGDRPARVVHTPLSGQLADLEAK